MSTPDEPMYEVPLSRLQELSAQRPVALVELPKFGKATRCELSRQAGPHPPGRFIWHHILPQACGGKTERANLAELCDNCHYAVHAVLWWLAHPDTAQPGATRRQRRVAQQGYAAAQAAGTAAKIPKEA
jgi:hypothetical protein